MMIQPLGALGTRRRLASLEWVCRVIVVLALLLVPVSGTASPVADRLVRVIVQRADMSPAAEAAARSLGGRVLMDLHLINSFVALVPQQALERLAAHPSVRSVSIDGPLVRHGESDDDDEEGHHEKDKEKTKLANTYNRSVEVLPAWEEDLFGQGITVAVVDSGVEKHTAKGKVKSDFGRDGERVRVQVNLSSISASPHDRFGHGTAVAGIIGGDGAISKGRYVGIAPRVNLVSVKVGGDDGSGFESDLVAGLQWVYDHREELGIRVVNLAVTAATPQSYHASPLDAAVEVLWFNGIVVVVAAGNNGMGLLYPPANDPFVITVGATDERGTPQIEDDVIPSWSASGRDEAGRVKPDIVAPGVKLITTLAPKSQFQREHPERVVDKYYFRFSGTSAAVSVVSGAVALLLQEEPDLTPDQVKFRLWQAAREWPGMDANRVGHGYLSVARALELDTRESANVGIPISSFLTPPDTPVEWDGVNWGGVNWGGVNWGGVNWGGVNWGGVNWGGVNWGVLFDN